MISTLYLMRHGETDGDGKKRYYGSIDIPLSARGEEQIKSKIAEIRKYLSASAKSKHLSYLKDVTDSSDMFQENNKDGSKLHAIYSSDLKRASRSAEIIAEAYGIKSIKIKGLRERNFGVWEGMSFTEITEKYRDEFRAWAENPFNFSPVGGESTADVNSRVIPALKEILRNHNGENILIVAHGGVNRVILSHILGNPLDNIFRIEQDYAALNIIEFWKKYPVLKLLNG